MVVDEHRYGFQLVWSNSWRFLAVDADILARYYTVQIIESNPNPGLIPGKSQSQSLSTLVHGLFLWFTVPTIG